MLYWHVGNLVENHISNPPNIIMGVVEVTPVTKKNAEISTLATA